MLSTNLVCIADVLAGLQYTCAYCCCTRVLWPLRVGVVWCLVCTEHFWERRPQQRLVGGGFPSFDFLGVVLESFGAADRRRSGHFRGLCMHIR